MTGLANPMPGHPVTQPFGGTYVGERSGYLQRDTHGPLRARPLAFSGGIAVPHCHFGVDIACPIGTPIVAPEKSKIVLNVIDPGSGDHYVLLQVRPGTLLEFSHLSKVLLPVGTVVAKGQKFALSGATGHVSGPHLHWMVLRNAVTNAPVYGWYGWLRYNPTRCLTGGDLAGSPWLVPA